MSVRLRELLRDATPGPWIEQVPGLNDPGAGTVYIDTHAYADGPQPVVAPSYPLSEADAALIVALRNEALALLDAHDRLAAALREAIDLAYQADACCDSEFRISSDPPCEREARLAELAAILTGTVPTGPGVGHGIIEYDDQDEWLVESDAEGASRIVARDVPRWFGRLVEAALREAPVSPGPGWGHSQMHECPPWHTADNHDRSLLDALRGRGAGIERE